MSAKKQYIDLFTEYEDVIRQHAPECMNALRTKALADFEKSGFPSLQQEDYRHTDVEQTFSPDFGLNLNRLQTPLNPADVFRCDVPNLSALSFFVVNDSFYEKTTLAAASLPEGVYAGGIAQFAERYPDIAKRYYGKLATTADDAISAFNTMFAQDCFVLYVPAGVKATRPIQLVNIFHSAVDIMANRRVLVILEPRAEARLLACDHTMDDVKCLGTQVVEIFVGQEAYFDYYDLEESNVSTMRFSSVYVRQEASSNVLINGITLHNGLSRNNYTVALEGEGAETTLCGMAIQYRNQQTDNCTRIIHGAPRCKSKELFKYILDEQAVGVFSGKIQVKAGADKTEACQTNRNMCLTRDARMYSQPQLEIDADDVKCSHGMTTGQLDEQALFYMQTRGLSREEARMLLSVAFAADVIENVRLDVLKDRLHYLIDKRFRGELAQCAGCKNCL